MTRYLIIIKESSLGYSAYVPDLPGCIAAAPTRTEVERQMQEAIGAHIRGLRLAGAEVPLPRSEPSYCDSNA